MRRSRGRTCTGKKPHPTQRDAQDHRWRLIRAGGLPFQLQVYRCPFCSTPARPIWHVGHHRTGRQ